MIRRLAPVVVVACAALLVAFPTTITFAEEPAAPAAGTSVDETDIPSLIEAGMAEIAASPELVRIAVCTEVDPQKRAPVGEAELFSSDVGRLWCFIKVVGASNPTQIFHRWYVGDSLVDEIPMTVRASTWRCWSNKGIEASWGGPCRVEILTESGDVIGMKEFELSGSPAAPPAGDDSAEG